MKNCKVNKNKTTISCKKTKKNDHLPRRKIIDNPKDDDFRLRNRPKRNCNDFKNEREDINLSGLTNETLGLSRPKLKNKNNILKECEYEKCSKDNSTRSIVMPKPADMRIKLCRGFRTATLKIKKIDLPIENGNLQLGSSNKYELYKQYCIVHFEELQLFFKNKKYNHYLNSEDFKYYFENKTIKKAFHNYINYIFEGVSVENLQEKFGISVKNPSNYNIETLIKFFKRLCMDKKIKTKKIENNEELKTNCIVSQNLHGYQEVSSDNPNDSLLSPPYSYDINLIDFQNTFNNTNDSPIYDNSIESDIYNSGTSYEPTKCLSSRDHHQPDILEISEQEFDRIDNFSYLS